MTDAKPTKQDFSARLLAWYDVHGRSLPWRAKPDDAIDPYRVWLSEIMLQQTTAAAVGPYFQRFLKSWPNVKKLAAAELDDVLAAWAGLGYYSRARNLHKCADVVVAKHKGRFPSEEAALLELPGIGRYTAAAIAAIAFDRPAVVVDGNVERVMARLFAVRQPIVGAKAALYGHAESLMPSRRFGDHAQALMDLGATVCTPRRPKCLVCPVAEFCQARAQGLVDALPMKAVRKKRPTRAGVVFWLQRPDGAVLLRRRPPTGLLGGMLEVPSSPWADKRTRNGANFLSHAPMEAAWRAQDGLVHHTFTHFHLELKVYTARLRRPRKLNGVYRWAPLDELEALALPTVMKKVARHALARREA